jgi:hypothetical protein
VGYAIGLWSVVSSATRIRPLGVYPLYYGASHVLGKPMYGVPLDYRVSFEHSAIKVTTLPSATLFRVGLVSC